MESELFGGLFERREMIGLLRDKVGIGEPIISRRSGHTLTRIANGSAKRL
ncbi:hypothetical protein [Burkholderia ubonensis]|nr:hypothetical protein [Burkholderia ubonensis]